MTKLNPYELLGVNKNATTEEIRKQYKKKALKCHPDKGGDPEEFKNLTKSYNILSDENKRRNYDQFGITDDDDNQSPFQGHDIGDIFGSMFGGGMNRQRQQRKQRQEIFEVDLETLYTGKKVRIKVERKIANGEVKHCEVCNGSGMISKVLKMGFVIQKVSSPCPKCHGEGSKVETKTCNEIIEFVIEKGCKSGKNFVFKNKGNVNSDGTYGDLILTVKEKKHSRFIRSHQNLIHKMSIGLVEALCGFEYELLFLDGTTLKVHYPNIIRPPNDEDSPFCLCLKGKGMPGINGGKPGDLLLVFDVLFPSTIPNELKQSLRKNTERILPELNNNKKESYLLEEVVLRQNNSQSYNVDSDDHAPECAQS